MVLDISTFAAKRESVGFPIKHPKTGEEMEGVKIFLFGAASDKVQRYREDALRKVCNEHNAKLRTKSNKEVVGTELTPEVVHESLLEMPVLQSDYIEGIEMDGKPINKKEQFEVLYSNPSYEWLLLQVKAIIEDDRNFI